jgi:hypothetical protein
MAFRLRSAGWAAVLAALTCVSIPVAQAQSASPITKEECQKLYDSVAGKMISALDKTIPSLEKMNNSWDKAIPRFRERLKTSAEIAKQAGEESVRALRRLRSTLEIFGTELQICAQSTATDDIKGFKNDKSAPPSPAPEKAPDKPAATAPRPADNFWDKVISSPRTEPFMDAVNRKVLKDALDRLNFLVENGGSYTDLCVHSGLVSAALVQVGDAERFKQFKSMEEAFCNAALSGKQRN